MGSIPTLSSLDYQRAVQLLKTADRYQRATLLEAMLQYDCVTNAEHDAGQRIAPSSARQRGFKGEDPYSTSER